MTINVFSFSPFECFTDNMSDRLYLFLEDGAAAKTEGNVLHALATGSGQGKEGLEKVSGMKSVYKCLSVSGYSSLHLFSSES